MSKIEAVIFDAGGVLHQGNTAVTDSLSAELGLSKGALKQLWNNEIELLGVGEVDETEFWRRVSKHYGTRRVDVEENLLGKAFAEQLVPFPKVLEIVAKLHKLGLKTAVLSNTIEPHFRALTDAGLYQEFDACFVSHEIGLRKPNPKIFTHVLQALATKPEVTVFIDDSIQNVEAAQRLGIHGVAFVSPDQLESDLKNLVPEL